MKTGTITAVATLFLLSECTISAPVVAENSPDKADSSQNYSPPLRAVLKDLGDRFQQTPSRLKIRQDVSGESVEYPQHATVILEEE